MYAAVRGACHVYNALPSSANGDGARFFCARAENMIFISLRLSDGTRASYVMLEDVCLAAIDAAGAQLHCVRAQVRLDAGSDNLVIGYTLDTDCSAALKEMRVRVHVCGALLVDVCVHKTFSGRTGGRLQSQHTLAACRFALRAAIHPAGTHLAVTDDGGSCVRRSTLVC